jgi:diguanylate cyclase (GGDEF)-like protein
MSEAHPVLLIEDNPGDARLIREMLAEHPQAPFRLDCADRLSRALEMLAAGEVRLILLDLSLPDSHGLDTFAKVYAHSPKVPIIVLTGNDDQTVALSAVKTGAQDYLVKGRLDPELLVRSMHYSIERKRYQEELEHQANYDSLTGLPNRALLRDRLRQAVFAQRDLRSMAVVFIDLDHFKFVNDSLGHSTGDQLLKRVAERLRSVVRDGDTVARLGGDEFVLILNDQVHDDTIYRALQRIARRVAEPMTLDGKEISITCSAGISLYPQDGPDVETLLKNADAAMYRAKEHGRNNFQFYTAEMNRLVSERLALESALRQALVRRELLLYYQPRFNLRTGAVLGMEALLRWMHPERGLMLPDRFIPLAEETGLIVQIGEWVLRSACAQARAWQDAGLRPVAVSVNLSARQFRQADLAKSVAQVLDDTGLPAQQLEIELTESMVMHDAGAAIATLRALKRLGLRLSVDDFGTGYSSLSYLKSLPIDALKIDQSFVRDIAAKRNGDGGLLARAIISLGHSLHLDVIAEGVENDSQARFLRKHGCDEVQGFRFGKPVPAERCARLLTARAPERRASRGRRAAPRSGRGG